MAGELLQALRTFLFNRESEEDLAEGEEKEFLRGTFSIMDIDENSKTLLDQLKTKFMNCKKDLGGLEVKEFEAALRPFISAGVSDAHIRTIFRKMDTSHQGAVSWEEFINFAITEHSMRLLMNETMDEMPFGNEVLCIKHQHRDPIVRISFMPNIDVNAKSVDWNFGKYMVLSREGIMSIWSLSLKSLSYNNLMVDMHKDQCWFLDMACMYHNGHVATVSSSRDLALYDYTVRGWIRKYHIRNLDNCACIMTYWAGLKTEQAILVMGDSNGSIVYIEFDMSNLTPMFGHSVREGCFSVFWSEILRGNCLGTTARVFNHVHEDWVKEVMYVPGLNSILSCCMDNDTAMYMTFVDPKKRTPFYFNAMKGILCFDYSHNLNVLACAGIEGSILLFNPYVPKRAVASMEAHIRPVTHLKINEMEQYTISVDMSKTIIIFSLVRQSVLQRLPGQSVRTGLHSINTIFLHSHRRVCLIGSKRMAYIKRHRLEDEINVDVRSHDFKIVGALYSQEFEQVVSVCRGSTVRVWDLNTGTRVMQFSRAHEKKKQGEWVPVEIECIALSENKRRLFTAAEGVVKIWNFNTGSVLRTMDISNNPRITSIVMSKRTIYITGWNKIINVLSDFKGEEGLFRTWATVHHSDCLSLCIMESNMIASSAYDGTICVWSRESTEVYCTLHPTVGPKPELSTSVRSGGNKQDIMHVAADLDTEENSGEAEEDGFMTIGRNLRKSGGWYRTLRALKKKQIEIEKKKALKEKTNFSARYKKKKKRINMQGLSLVYESAVECLVFLGSRRLIDPHTATLVAAGAECWIRFWSIHPAGGILAQFNATRRKLESILTIVTDKENEYLFTGDTLGFMRIFDIKEFCNADKLTQEERDLRNMRLKHDFGYTTLPFHPEQMLDTMERLREKKISVPDASKPRTNLKAPRLLSSIRAHTMAITSLEFIEERNVILTASHDLTVRLWTKNCTYIGTFGETWRPIPKRVGRVVERPPRIPHDVLRVASAHSLATLHNGRMPHWKNACYLVRRHIYEMRKERQIEEARMKMKEEKMARGEVDSETELTADGERPVSKILGKYYKPDKKFLGPITLADQGLPKLLLFKVGCSPYHSIIPRALTCMDPLYKPSTFFDIDSRRQGGHVKTRRSTKNMMNTFNTICCDPERYGGARMVTSIHESNYSQLSVGKAMSAVSKDRSTNYNPNPGERTPDLYLDLDLNNVALHNTGRYGRRGIIQESIRAISERPGSSTSSNTAHSAIVTTTVKTRRDDNHTNKENDKQQVPSPSSLLPSLSNHGAGRGRGGGGLGEGVKKRRVRLLSPDTNKNNSPIANRSSISSISSDLSYENVWGSQEELGNHKTFSEGKRDENISQVGVNENENKGYGGDNNARSLLSQRWKQAEKKYGNIFDTSRDRLSVTSPEFEDDVEKEWNTMCELSPGEYFGFRSPTSWQESEEDDESSDTTHRDVLGRGLDYDQSHIMRRIRDDSVYCNLPSIASERRDQDSSHKGNVRYSHLLK